MYNKLIMCLCSAHLQTLLNKQGICNLQLDTACVELVSASEQLACILCEICGISILEEESGELSGSLFAGALAQHSQSEYN